MTNGFIDCNQSLLACPKSNPLFRFRSFLTLVFLALTLALALLIVPLKAIAIPSAEFLYTETDLGDGWWQYDYTLYNTSDPDEDAGYDIYDVAIYFTNPDPFQFEGLSLPTDWDGIPWIGINDGADPDLDGIYDAYAYAFSLNSGPPPVGADIPPGSLLDGFSLKINYYAGDVVFDVLFTNPSDANNPAYDAGTTSSQISPVPEPGTLLLVAAGLTLILLIIRIGKLRFRYG